jgi:hypothetical protein
MPSMKLKKMWAALREVTRTLVEQLIDIAESENERLRTRFSQSRDAASQAAGAASPVHFSEKTVKDFVGSLSPRCQQELVALMLLGREPHFFDTAQDFAAACEPTARLDPGTYLGSKGHLGDYLKRALDLLTP